MNGYKVLPLSFVRQMVAASASVTREKNTIHSITEVDITVPRRMIKEYYERTGVKLSFTAYIVSCLSKVVVKYPEFNSFIKRKKLIILNDVTISVLVEREINGEKFPEPIGIKEVNKKTIFDIQSEIRKTKEIHNNQNSLRNFKWIRFIPLFLVKMFIRIADKNLRFANKYGKVCVTSIGMFSNEAVWFVPHGSATVLLTVGSVISRVVKEDRGFVEREHLCLTVSFDHDIIDGAPAARFMNDLICKIKSGELIECFIV